MERVRKIHYAWWILLGCCLIQLTTLGTIVNAGSIYFLEIVKDFNANGQAIAISDLSLFYTAQSLAIVVGLSFANPLLKRFDLRLLMTVGIVAMVVAQGAMAFFHHAPLWGLSGLLFGIFVPVVGIIPPTLMLMNWFHEKKGTVIAIQSAFGGIGGAVMNPLTELLIQQFGWRATYLLTAGFIALIALPFTLFVFRMTPAETGRRAFGAREEALEHAEPATEALELPGVTVQQAKQTPTFWLIMISMVCLGFTMSITQFLKAYADTLQWQTLGATMMSLAMIGGVSGNLLMGSLADRIGLKKVYQGGATAIALGLFLLIVGRGNMYMLLLGCLLYGMLQGLTMVGTPLLIQESFGGKDYANIFSKLSRVQSIISALSFYGIARLAELFGSTAQPNYIPLFMVGGVLSFLLSLMIPFALQAAPMTRKPAALAGPVKEPR